MGFDCIPDAQLKSLTEVSRYVDELSNVVPHDSMPFVGNSAFAHKGGVHVSAVLKDARFVKDRRTIAGPDRILPQAPCVPGALNPLA